MVVAAVEAEFVLCPGTLQYLEHLDKPLAAFRIRHAIRLVHARKATASNTENQPAVADLIHRRGFLGKLQRVAKRQDLHRGADLHPLGARGDRGGDHQRRGKHRAFRRGMQLGQPHHVQAIAFGSIYLLEGVGERLFLGLPRHSLKLMEHAEFHRLRSPLNAGVLSIHVPGRTGWAWGCRRARHADCRRIDPGCAHCRCSDRRPRCAG